MIVDAVLKEAGFVVSEKCRSRPSCFDFAARKNEKIVFVKLQQDIGNLSPEDSREFKTISELFSASPILLGEKTREKPLEDDTIYSRYKILALTPATLESIALRQTYPLIQANPGGYYVEVNGKTIRRRRQELGLSVGEIAKMIGISRRTLYGYERGMAKAPVTVTYNLMSTLGIPVGKPVDVFKNLRRQRKCSFLLAARRLISRNTVLQRIFRKFSNCQITVVKKAPFDFVISVPENNRRIIGGVAKDSELGLDRRVNEILSVSTVVQARPVLITNGQASLREDITCINNKEIANIKHLEDLIVDA